MDRTCPGDVVPPVLDEHSAGPATDRDDALADVLGLAHACYSREEVPAALGVASIQPVPSTARENLSFNLASPGSADNRTVFAQLMLDEAFSKSDKQFAQQALQAFREFGFQLVIVATVRTPSASSPISTAW